MKRRELLEEVLTPTDAPAARDEELVSPFANRSLPKVARTTAGLELYTGAWTDAQAVHLLRRTTFGPSKSHLDAVMGLSMSTAVDALLAPWPEEPTQPLTYVAPSSTNGEVAPLGTTWVNSTFRNTDPVANPNNASPTGIRINSLKAWWMGLLLNQQLSIREKMTLFWHNHFVTEILTVGDPRYSYRYIALLRRSALGNFRDLARDITIDGAMLVYLNGTANTKTGPDENYARELQELFTIGKGPLAGPGDYTNYTEADVKAAARVLTGWRRYQNPDGTVGQATGYFDLARHDTTNKIFSARYNNAVITGGTNGVAELAALLDMIFAQPETAKFICRKLYRWFVYYVIDDVTEANVITPMADILRQNNYVIAPALSALLKSAHFYDPVNMGCMIKSPIDLIAGVCRQFGVAPPQTSVTTQYQGWYNLAVQGSSMQQDIGEPPNVAGWPAYYQNPEFYELWINSDTLPKRSRLTDLLIGNGYSSGGVTLVIDPLAFARTFANPADPNAVVDEAGRRLFPLPLTESQQSILKSTLVQGLPDYEWSNEWNAYLADPTNTNVSKPIKTKLQALLGLMLRMPEFQLL
ncbi:MAG: DUF1800 domain-containing protein [Bacteroidota bacterium]